MRGRITFKERFLLTLTWPLWSAFMLIACILLSVGSLAALLFVPNLTVKKDSDEISVLDED